jgi:hypothetical protein
MKAVTIRKPGRPSKQHAAPLATLWLQIADLMRQFGNAEVVKGTKLVAELRDGQREVPS